MCHLTHFRALSGGGCKPGHRGLEPLTQSRAAQTAAYEVTAFIAMDAPFMGISNAGANRFNLVFSGRALWLGLLKLLAVHGLLVRSSAGRSFIRTSAIQT